MKTAAMYKLIRTILFLFDQEKINHFAVCYLKFLFKIPIISNIIKSHQEINDKRLEREVFGLKFKNPVGLAAWFDKYAKLNKFYLENCVSSSLLKNL